MKFDLSGKKGKPDCVPLAPEEVDQCGSCVNGKGQFIVRHSLAFGPGKQHGRRGVNDQLTAEVGLFLVLLYKKLVGPGEEFPIDGPGRLPLVIQPVFGEFYGKTVERTPVKAGNKSFHHFPCNKFQVIELLKFLNIFQIFHPSGLFLIHAQSTHRR